MRPPGTFVLGLDALDPGLLRAWSAAGHLPFLGRILVESQLAELVNPPGFFVGAVWTSLGTGTCPSRHTRYCHVRVRPGSYLDERFSPALIEADFLWKRLSDAGRRVVVVDVPKVGLVPDLQGFQVTSWGAHDQDEFQTWPPGLAAELRGRYGPPAIHSCDDFPHDRAGLQELAQLLVRRVELRTDMVLDLLGRGHTDLALAVYSEAHCGGHHLWHLHDPLHPLHDTELRATFSEDPLLTIYRALDAGAARLAEALGSDSRLVVVCSHGMGPMLGAGHLLPSILERLDGARPALGARLFHHARAAWRRLPASWRKRVGISGAQVVDARRQTNARDRGRRRFYVVENNNAAGAVRINLVGREAEGKVGPGAEYNAVCAELIEALQDLVDVDTGRPVVRRVFRTDALYGGPRRDYLPDLLIDWDQGLPCRGVRSARLGRVEAAGPVVRTGDHPHTGRGLVLVRGPGIEPGELPRSIPSVDLAPTLAAWAGVELDDVDGEPVPELLGQPGRGPNAARPGWIGAAEG